MRASFALVCLLLSLAPSNSAPGPEPAHLLILKLEDSEKEGLLDAQNGKANIRNKIQFDDKELKIQLISDKETVENHPAITRASNDHHVVDITREASDFNELDTNPRALTILDMINNQEPDAEGRKCVKKTMMRRETVYEEVMTCDHTYDERCHTSYTTTYEPHQEEECDEKFRKVCMISNEQKAVTEMVEECTTPLVPDCTKEGPEVCRTVYDTVCHTKRVGYEVEEQFPVCTTVNMTKCQDVTLGLITEQECEVWPVQQCEVEDRKVTHTQPRTECRKEPRQLCAPGDCPLVEGELVCAEKMKTVVVDTPVETCDMEPQEVCKQITKLVPQLKPIQECVQVPKEVCATSRINPTIKNTPYIQKWCFKPEEVVGDNSFI